MSAKNTKPAKRNYQDPVKLRRFKANTADWEMICEAADLAETPRFVWMRETLVAAAKRVKAKRKK